MEVDWAYYIKLFLSGVVGFGAVIGSVIFFNSFKQENPKLKIKHMMIGLSLFVVGFGTATAYHYASRYEYLPQFLMKSEAEKNAERKKELKKAQQEEEARKKAEKVEDLEKSQSVK